MRFDNLTRREVLKGVGVLSAGLMLGSLAKTEAESKVRKASDRPNILFVIADDWSWPHAGAYGDKVIQTPAFDRVAREGVLFTNAFCAAPTCTASRGAILTGQAIHRLDEGADLWSTLPKRFPVYPDLLESAGYFIGHTGKGWGPGNDLAGGRTRNPAGPKFDSFDNFIQEKPKDKPFCFWFGSLRPHRPYEQGRGIKLGLRPEDVTVPPFLPDTPEVRSDLLDYYEAAQQYDAQVGQVLKSLDESGLAENTLCIVTSDNGLPFPRAKCNLYDSGTRMPLAIRWPAKIKPGRTEDDLIGFTDFAPTFVEAAGLKPLSEMTGHSFLRLLTNGESNGQDCVFTERERHGNARSKSLSYPIRAIRTKDFLYIRNLRPHLWPAGEPDVPTWKFCDMDVSPTRNLITDKRDDPDIAPYFKMACGKRPEEELYDIAKDPWQLNNIAEQPKYAEQKKQLKVRLEKWMEDTNDPRAHGEDDRWDKYPYYG